MGLLDHLELMIIKGVGKTAGDTQSSEVDPTVLDLLGGTPGYSLSDWSPNIPSLKSGGVWADSPIADGRTLIAGVNTNVIETIVVNLTGSTGQDFASQFAKLQRMIQDARDYWDTFNQIEPVYLRWWASCAPAPQFALIYNIDLDVEFQDGATAQARITMSIEREFGWRGVRPGGNPKEWYYHSIGQDSQWKASNAHLLTGSDHLVTGTIQNRAEQNSSASGYNTQNFIDIPAAKIPGDIPALVSISVQQAVAVSATTILIGKTTVPTSGNISRNTGNNQLTVYNFNAADGVVSGADTTLGADTGSPKNQSGTNNRSTTTFATTTTMSNRLSWYSSTAAPNGFSQAVFRGRFAVFARARVSAAATVVTLQLSIKQGTGNDLFTTTPVTLTDLGVGGTGNTTDWALVYLGQVGIPLNNQKTEVGPDGRGVWVDPTGGSSSDISVKLNAARTSVGGSLYVADLIFMPIGEGAINIVSSLAVGSGAVVLYNWAYDNTGYFTHGVPGDFGSIQLVSGNNNLNTDTPVLSGSPIYLTPNTINRLYFLAYVDSTKRSFISDPSAMSLRVNIVPRWSGIRDI